MKNNQQLDKFYKKEVMELLDSMKKNVALNLCPRLSAVGLLELTENWAKVKIELGAEKDNKEKEHKLRAKGSRADRRSGKSIKQEGKVSKSKAKTKEIRSSKKIANIKKTRSSRR